MAYSGWAFVELMGHRERAGLVCEEEIAGARLLRIDIPVPASGGEPADGSTMLTEFYGGGAIYALRPCSEELARNFVRHNADPRPIQPLAYRLPPPAEKAADDGPDYDVFDGDDDQESL